MLIFVKFASGALASAVRCLMPVSAVLAAVFFRRPVMIPEAEYSSASGYHGEGGVGVSLESVERHHGSEGRADFLGWHNAERGARRASSVMLDDGFVGTEVEDYVRWAKGYRPKSRPATTRTCPGYRRRSPAGPPT